MSAEFTPDGEADDVTAFVTAATAGRPYVLHVGSCIPRKRIDVLLDVFGNFVVQALNSHSAGGIGISILCFFFIVFVSMIELLVAAIQAYVFAILTSLYISEAVHLH